MFILFTREVASVPYLPHYGYILFHNFFSNIHAYSRPEAIYQVSRLRYNLTLALFVGIMYEQHTELTFQNSDSNPRCQDDGILYRYHIDIELLHWLHYVIHSNSDSDSEL